MKARLSGAESLAASALALFSVPILTAYLLDLAGRTFPPLLVVAVSCLGAAVVFRVASRGATWTAVDTSCFAGIVVVVLGWLLWFARGGVFPPGRGSDLTHHLMLIDYIDSHWRLPHEADAEASLGIMAPYPPGVHLLASFAGWIARSDGLHAVYGVVAASVALKTAFLFLIGARTFRDGIGGRAFALAGAAMFFVPRVYSIGSFTEFSFFAQVMAEFFATAMWWSLIVWFDDGRLFGAALFALAGMAAFLTWPVLVGPLGLALVLLTFLPTSVTLLKRAAQCLIAGAPIAAIACAYIVNHGHWLGMVRTGGAVVWPSVGQYGWWFVALSVAGIAALASLRSGYATLVVGFSLALQTVVLWRVAASSGADTPYLALKMLYFAAGIQAVSAAAALSWVERLRMPALAWAIAAVVCVAAARPLMAAARPASLMSEPLYEAGVWARDNVPGNCVEYLVGDDGTAYWLHLAVLRNKWMAPRTGVDATYHPRDAVVRWLTPGGLPYAIADLPALPSDVRRELDIVADFGTAAVVKRRGPSSCDTSVPTR